MDDLNEAVPRLVTHSTAKAWRERKGRYRLEGTRCPACDLSIFPRRPICPKCRRRDLPAHEFGPTGRVVCTAVNYYPLTGHAETLPQIRALIRLTDGPVLMADVVDATVEDVREGTAVELVVRKVRRETNGNVLYSFKFRPCAEDRNA